VDTRPIGIIKESGFCTTLGIWFQDIRAIST